MDIIRAQLSDLDALRTFAEYTFRVAYEQDNDPWHFENYCKTAFSVDQWEQEMQYPASEFWLAKAKDILVGYLKLNFDQHQELIQSQNTLQIERIYLDPAFQGQGHGKQLLSFAESEGRKAGRDWIWLSVWQKNPRAVRFYEQSGYDICGTEIFPIGDDLQLDWVMKKRL